MPFTKIVPADLQGKGVIGQPAVPGLSVTEMQESVEQIVREVAIPAVNRLVDELGATTAAGNIGAVVPDGLSAEPTVQDVVSAIHEAANSGKDEVAGDLEQHKSNTSNPHAVTAAQTGAYTKEETDQAISDRISDIGAGDMAQAVYDPTGKRTDIFAYCATAAQGEKADTAVQTVNGKGGPAVSLVPELLWTNPAPGQAFAAQSVNFDTKNYTWFVVSYAAGSVNKLAVMQRDVLSTLVQNTFYNYTRAITISTNAALIRNCLYYPEYGKSQTSTYNSGAIPNYIYGLV